MAFIALVFSGCATKNVSDIVDVKPIIPFEIQKVSKAYFTPNMDKIFVDTDIKYKEYEKQERACYIFDVDMNWLYHRVFLTKNIRMECLDDNALQNYKNIPILEGKIIGSWKWDESDINSSVPWRVKTTNDDFYIDYSKLQEGNNIILEVGNKETPNINKGAYILYPFAIAFDVVTFPLQLVGWILEFSNLSEGNPFPMWPGWQPE